MPHLILEYTDPPADNLSNEEMMRALHAAALGTGLFDEATIKVRLRRYETAFVGGQPDGFAHVTIYLIDGRDKPTKKRLAITVHDAMRAAFSGHGSVSVDVRDLDRDIYTKSQL